MNGSRKGHTPNHNDRNHVMEHVGFQSATICIYDRWTSISRRHSTTWTWPPILMNWSIGTSLFNSCWWNSVWPCDHIRHSGLAWFFYKGSCLIGCVLRVAEFFHRYFFLVNYFFSVSMHAWHTHVSIYSCFFLHVVSKLCRWYENNIFPKNMCLKSFVYLDDMTNRSCFKIHIFFLSNFAIRNLGVGSASYDLGLSYWTYAINEAPEQQQNVKIPHNYSRRVFFYGGR